MGEEKTALAAPALSRLASRETSPSTYAPRALARPHEEDAVWRSMRAGGEQDALAVLGVPPWRPLMHHAATELGYADVHVPGGSHSVSVEELQRGWIASSPVASDTGTIRQSIYERLHHADMLTHISDVLDHVRSSRRHGPVASCPCLPQRLCHMVRWAMTALLPRSYATYLTASSLLSTSQSVRSALCAANVFWTCYGRHRHPTMSLYPEPFGGFVGKAH